MSDRGARIVWMLVLCIGLTSVYSQDYYSHVRPIIIENCFPCHASGGIGLIPLTTYAEVSSYAAMIAQVTQERYMPPWLPESTSKELVSERVLDDEDLILLNDWLKNGLKIGQPQIQMDSMTLAAAHDQKEQDLIVLPVSNGFEHYGVYYEQYQNFLLSYDTDYDVYIDSIALVPGDSSIVRSVRVATIKDTMAPIALDEWDPREGYYHFGSVGIDTESSIWYTWQPDQEGRISPPGTSWVLKKGHRLLVHIVYGPSLKAKSDSTHLILRRGPRTSQTLCTEKIIDRSDLLSDPFPIPSGKTAILYAVDTLSERKVLRSIYIHGQLYSRKWEVFIKSANGEAIELLKILDYDLHRNEEYHLRQPLTLEAGATIHVRAHYDNTEKNPYSPSNGKGDLLHGYGMFKEIFTVEFGLICD